MSKEYYKAWYAKNKEKHNKYCNEKQVCEVCNITTSRSNIDKHKATKKHLLMLKIKELESNKISE